ncbi:MAG TPA: TraB/GumN family protein [Rhizomicrobium sp.]|nr:TraB/GumN family protein [Rhizomicrobium sp.]
MIWFFRLICSFAVALFFPFITPATAAAEAPPVIATIKAHPALWTVHSSNATAYLFGSVHLLPPNIDWHSAAIDAALKSSDVFVFEAPMGAEGQAQTEAFVRANGMLPANEALPSLLDPRARKDYRTALAAAHADPAAVVHMRPWLAAIVMQTSALQASHYSRSGGVDLQLWDYANTQHKKIEIFETIDEQLALLMPKDQKLEKEEFEAELKELKTSSGEIGALVDAWCDGRISEVARLMNEGLSTTPGAMKLLIDDRNARWAKRLDIMLAEPHTYFITVGAGHLAGPHGLPALLKARNYKVEMAAGPT